MLCVACSSVPSAKNEPSGGQNSGGEQQEMSNAGAPMNTAGMNDASGHGGASEDGGATVAAGASIGGTGVGGNASGAGGVGDMGGQGGAGDSGGEPSLPVTDIPAGAIDCRSRGDGECAWCQEMLNGGADVRQDESFVYDKSLNCPKSCEGFGPVGVGKKYILSTGRCARVTVGNTGKVDVASMNCVPITKRCTVTSDPIFYVMVDGADWVRVETVAEVAGKCSLTCD